MTQLFNKQYLKPIRRKLRKDQTFAEKIVWLNVRRRELLGLKFKRQFSVDNYIIDFYCPEHKIALEIDGEIHDKPENIIKDKIRQRYLESFGIKFIRVTNSELLGNPNKAFERIEREIKEIINS